MLVKLSFFLYRINWDPYPAYNTPGSCEDNVRQIKVLKYNILELIPNIKVSLASLLFLMSRLKMGEVNHMNPSKFRATFGQTGHTFLSLKKALRLHSAWSLLWIEFHSPCFENNNAEYYKWKCQGKILEVQYWSS